jgi:hypothetical protein
MKVPRNDHVGDEARRTRTTILLPCLQGGTDDFATVRSPLKWRQIRNLGSWNVADEAYQDLQPIRRSRHTTHFMFNVQHGKYGGFVML